MDYETFRDAYPEFASSSPGLVEAKLLEAESQISRTAFGDQYDTAHGYLTAHLLWSSPYGAGMRLEGGGESTESRYLRSFNALRLATVPRIIVT